MVNRLTNPLQDRPVPLGTLLGAATRRLVDELNLGLHAAGFDDLRAAHASVFQAIDAEGTRVTDLAAAIGTTKQAAGELVRYLEQRGYVEIRPVPGDRRAKLVHLTEKGWDAVAAGEAVINTFDAWLDERIGTEMVTQLRDTLHLIVGDSVDLGAFGATSMESAQHTESLRSSRGEQGDDQRRGTGEHP